MGASVLADRLRNVPPIMAFRLSEICAILPAFNKCAAKRGGGAGINGEANGGRRPRRRIARTGTALRLRRIFARVREGASYVQIATEEGVTLRRIRQIVAETLKEQPVDSETEHARLQLARLEPALKVAAEAIGAGDVRAVAPHLRVLERIDHYATSAVVNREYDEEARQKLLDKLKPGSRQSWLYPEEGCAGGRG